MGVETLAGALEREHREIDSGIEAFTSSSSRGPAEVEGLTQAVEALRRHIYLEEELLFPALRSAGLMAPVFVMLREHGEMWRLLDALEAEISADPAGPYVDGLIEQLVPQLEAHNVKEEAILYPQSSMALGEDAEADLREFMESGRRPQGWVCEMART